MFCVSVRYEKTTICLSQFAESKWLTNFLMSQLKFIGLAIAAISVCSLSLYRKPHLDVRLHAPEIPTEFSYFIISQLIQGPKIGSRWRVSVQLL